MFHLFRRHQKVLLTTIATVAICSMVFSAVAPLFMDQKPLKAKGDLITAVDQGVMCLFNHGLDASETQIIFPEALFTQALLDTGILETTYGQIKDQVDRELNQVWEKIQAYSPPEIFPGTSYFDVIGQISPALLGQLHQLKKAEHLSGEEKVRILSAFFHEKSKLPLSLMVQYLQAVSKNKISINIEDLYFFGLKNPEDFFGKTLLKESTKNLSQALVKEVKGQKAHELIQQTGVKLSKFYGSSVHPNQFFIAVGMTPECGLAALKLFEALKQVTLELSQQLLLDPLTHKSFSEFASQKIPVNCYVFHQDLEPKTLEEAVYLDLYAQTKNLLNFDQYDIKIRSLDKTKAFQKLPKKQLYAESLKGYQELSALMPYALSAELGNDKDKLEAIKNLKGSSQALLEKHLQKVCLKNDPQFFQKMLQELPAHNEVVYLTKGGKYSPIEGFKSLDQLKEELDILPLNTPVMFDLGDAVLCEIELVSKLYDQKGMDYKQAIASGVLKEKLKAELDVIYKELLAKTPSKLLDAHKKIKSFDEAFQDVLDIKAKDLKKKMALSLGVSADLMPDFLLKGYPKVVLSQIKTDLNHSDDFRIEKQTRWLLRSEETQEEIKALFSSADTVMSEVILSADGHYRVFEKTGPLTEGELMMDKTALDVLAKEKIKEHFHQKLQAL